MDSDGRQRGGRVRSPVKESSSLCLLPSSLTFSAGDPAKQSSKARGSGLSWTSQMRVCGSAAFIPIPTGFSTRRSASLGPICPPELSRPRTAAR
eukprot:scaffold7351_cov259-Pinguiococcus_pyrenoidosus.AAC.23